MKKKNFYLFIVIALLITLAIFGVRSVQAQYFMATTAELTKESDNIVRGIVKSMKSEWNDEKNYIWTFVTISVTETTKGDTLDEKEIIVKIPGGVVGEIGQRSEYEVVFEKGEEVLLFLKPEVYKEKQYFQVTRLFMGKFTIKDDRIIETKTTTYERSAAMDDSIIMRNHLGNIVGVMRPDGESSCRSAAKMPESLRVSSPTTAQNRE